MTYYCKAYPMDRLVAFEGWPEETGDTSDIVFVHEDFSVRTSSLPDSEDTILLPSGDSAFRAFCETELGFSLPDWSGADTGSER